MLGGSKIGTDCRIGQNVVIGPKVDVGNGVKIQNNVSVYEGVTLEDDVFCGPSMVFTNVMNPRSEIPRMGEMQPRWCGEARRLAPTPRSCVESRSASMRSSAPERSSSRTCPTSR